MAKYRNIGLAVVEWHDAAQWERVESLEQVRTLKQITTGNVFERTEDGALIIVYSVQEGGEIFDAVIVPKCWALNIIPLKEVEERRVKCRRKS